MDQPASKPPQSGNAGSTSAESSLIQAPSISLPKGGGAIRGIALSVKSASDLPVEAVVMIATTIKRSPQRMR